MTRESAAYDIVRLCASVAYNEAMVRQIEAIFRDGAFRPVEPVTLPEGTRVHLSVEEEPNPPSLPATAKIRTPRLANPKDVADFVMEVRENRDAGL